MSNNRGFWHVDRTLRFSDFTGNALGLFEVSGQTHSTTTTAAAEVITPGADIIVIPSPEAERDIILLSDDDDVIILSDDNVEDTMGGEETHHVTDHSQMVTTNITEEAKENVATCGVCLSDTHALGNHRLVSLRCGHLYGESCVFEWLDISRTCPACREPARHSHVHLIYGESVKVREGRAPLEAEAEIARLQNEIEILNGQMGQLKQKVANLKRRAERTGAVYRMARSNF